MKKHKTRAFPKEEMLHLINGGSSDSYEIIHQELIDHNRWTVTYELLFREIQTGVYYRAYYNEQDETPWEYEDEVIASIVVPREVTVLKYFPVEVDA